MNNSRPYVKIDRSIINWEHYKDPMVKAVFLDLIFACYTIPTKKNGKVVEAGKVLTTISEIMNRTGIKSKHTIIDALKTLEQSGEITRERIGNETFITINNFIERQGGAKNALPKEEGGANNAPQRCNKCTTEVQKMHHPTFINDDNKLSSLKRNILENNKTLTNGACENLKPQKIGFDKYGPDGLVELRPQEYRTLAEQYGEDQLKDAIKGLNDNIADGSTESTSHYHTLRKWLEYRKKNDKPKSTLKVNLNALKI